MRSGPLGRREAYISRFIEGALSGFIRPACTDPLGSERVLNRRARPARLRKSTSNSPPESPPLKLQCALPINLREFLAEQFDDGDGLRIDEDGVFTLGHGAGEDALSRVARAIRRYSTERAHERWDECATALIRLSGDLDRAAQTGERLVLCLGCAAIDTGDGAAGRHREAGCLTVELSAMLNGESGRAEESRDLTERLRRTIEGFRLGRAALGLAHYDLDCYIARGQVIFTWRPESA